MISQGFIETVLTNAVGKQRVIPQIDIKANRQLIGVTIRKKYPDWKSIKSDIKEFLIMEEFNTGAISNYLRFREDWQIYLVETPDKYFITGSLNSAVKHFDRANRGFTGEMRFKG